MKNLLILIFVLNSFISFSQENPRNLEYMYDKMKYIGDISSLESFYQTNPSKKVAFELGDAFYHIKKYEKALIYYEMGITYGGITENQMLNYFSSLYEYGDIEMAKKIAMDYRVKYGKKNLLAKLDSAENMRALEPVYFEDNLSLNTTSNESGLIPLYGSFKIINSDVNLYRYNSEPEDIKLLDAFIINFSDTATVFRKYIPLGVRSDKYNDVVTHYDESESKVYITRSTVRSKNHNNLKMYIAILDENIGLANLTEFPYNSNEYSVGHACVSKDGEMLYFVSDMPGGYGGSDIYRCLKLEDGTWGSPINVGNNVNTAGDEMYPYISPQGNMLYFSSTGHSIFGGLDLNKSEKTRFHSFNKPENLGLPFNSSKDDFGIVFKDNYGSEGFFSSNRLDGKGGDDIYGFSYQNNKVCRDPVKNFKMKVIDKKTRQPISKVKLKMTVKSDGREFEDVTNEAGEVFHTVEGCTDFDVEATHDFYLNNLFYYDGFRKSVTIELDKKELNNIIGLESIYYELGKYEIPNLAIPQLEKLSILLKRNKDVKIELSSHTDSRADDVFNMTLSQKRAEKIVQFLELSGVNRLQLVATGYGESKLVNECGNNIPCSESMHEKNRRTEFKILEITK